MSWQVVFAKQAQKDAKNLASAGLKEKAQRLLGILAADPFQVPPPYEKLVGDLSGAYSRRINIQHRLIYQVLESEHIVKVLRMWTHYEWQPATFFRRADDSRLKEMKASARYAKIVEWSDEDQCYVGSSPGLAYGGCHGDNETAVFEELIEIVEEAIALYEEQEWPLPPPTSGRDYANKMQHVT